jgi:hypothetical protein
MRIEPRGSKLKTPLRPAQARSLDTLNAAMAEALVTSSVTAAWGWFRHGGDALHFFESCCSLEN